MVGSGWKANPTTVPGSPWSYPLGNVKNEELPDSLCLTILHSQLLINLTMTPHILIVDDDEMMLKTMEFRLVKEGYHVILCPNGQVALDKIVAENPDLIISDIMMPFISGLDIVNKVKIELKLNIPIIILSAVGLEKTVLQAFKLGADDFITKPFSPNELSVRVKRLLLQK